ncbi:phage tail protein [Cyanobacteria bacterium FACHB-63]|nr:phage tail protein [Cyanobacteria bacterium FACHB-63]
MSIVGANAAFAASTGQLGIRLDPYMGYNFLLEIDGLLTGGFSRVSGLSSEIVLEEYQEGGVNGSHKFPTRVNYPPLVLSRGLTDIDTLWSWYWNASQGNVLRLNGSIMLLDRQRIPVVWWNFRSAYPVKWTGPEFEASNTNQLAIESIELVHSGLEKHRATQIAGAGRSIASLGGLTGV